MSKPIVEIKDLHLSLIGGAGPVNILRGINFRVAAGETISVVGPSGAGKTTLLMALSGLEQPTSGRITVAGTDLQSLNEDGLARPEGIKCRQVPGGGDAVGSPHTLHLIRCLHRSMKVQRTDQALRVDGAETPGPNIGCGLTKECPT